MAFLALRRDSFRRAARYRKIRCGLNGFGFRTHAIKNRQPVGLHIGIGVMLRQPFRVRFSRFEVPIREREIELVEFFRVIVHMAAK